MRRLLLLATVVVAQPRNPHKESIRFCEAYVQCAAVALLEERLCLGNSLLRPYWLPDSRDKHNCHEKLRNDYIKLEKMEEKLDMMLTSCLIKNSLPFTDQQMKQCDSATLKSAARFSYGRSIYYVPTHCFTGVEKRRERECGRVQSCCAAVSKCSSISTDSELAKSINEVRIQMRKRAKDCENGIPIEKLVLPPGYAPTQQDDASAPSTSGYVTVNFNEAGSKKQEEARADDGGGYVNVHISTADHSGYDNKASEYQGRNGKETLGGDSSNSGYDQGETVGQVSSPVGDGDYEKVKFPHISNREGGPRSELTEENGSLTISSKPRLSFPGDVVAVATREGVVVVDLHGKDANSNHTTHKPFPRNNKTHDENFEHAMKNTIEYKARIEQMNRGEAARQGLESLLQAGQAVGKVSANPVGHPGAVEPAVPKVSGSMRSFEMTDDQPDDDQRRGEFVTSSPVIFVGKNDSSSRVSDQLDSPRDIE
ncbi:hypothetical protein Y032_0326g2576 [Ancylostoma ceylanicum]|uniref:Uncharacterized protein n=1 Tax=Ancylostoma ceylanicum TaxID=53326 RepID=A0A016S0B7_9BILA|nr:hypothetical protein Y032_0326g2576 [Ancylostoma ceylanicum]